MMKELTLEDLTKAKLIELCRMRCFPRPCSQDFALVRVYLMALRAKKLIDEGKLHKASALADKMKKLEAEYRLLERSDYADV